MLQKTIVPYIPTLKETVVVPDVNLQELTEPVDDIYTLTLEEMDLTESFNALAKHIGIIAESRKLIKEGKTQTWKEFEKGNGTKKR